MPDNPKLVGFYGRGDIYAQYDSKSGEVIIKADRLDGEHIIVLTEDAIDTLIKYLVRSGHDLPKL